MLELVSLGAAPHQLHAAALDSAPSGCLCPSLFFVLTALLTFVPLAPPQDRTEGFVAWLIPRARAVCKLTLTATRDEEAVAAMGLAGGSQLGPLVLQASRVGRRSRSSGLPKSPPLPVHALADCAAAPAKLEVSHPACLTWLRAAGWLEPRSSRATAWRPCAPLEAGNCMLCRKFRCR